ncbi:MAG: hypothetical protein KGJ49_09135 [Alphaproteobacteria bacterium]|nr:hypothetical protein [Alphaproteobacteria bacterium]
MEKASRKSKPLPNLSSKHQAGSDKYAPSKTSTLEFATVYSDDFVGDLVREFGISTSEQINALEVFLRQSAHTYKTSKTRRPHDDELRILHKKLLMLSESVNNLTRQLSQLTNSERDRLWNPIWHGQQKPEIVILDPRLPVGFGRDLMRYGFAEENQEYESEHRTRDTLVELNTLILSALEDIPHKKNLGGRPSDDALLHWVVAARLFWERELGRRFSYHAIPNGPESTIRKSMAFRFCKRAIAPLIPKLSEQALATAMRHAQKFRLFSLTLKAPDRTKIAGRNRH